ncbi:Amino acid transporter [Trypanosoma melophagium]|uniref:Amino acid transporter n=1 Tax=Trypanosoma melophagium TaxID=715481 RepID=UPI003519FEBE|nr:Amino acid transporter [Trypanosoma melophagium]
MSSLNEAEATNPVLVENVRVGSPHTTTDPTKNSGEKGVNCLKLYSRRFIPDGGFLSGVFNLAGGSLGAGILGLPSAFHASGILMGTLYLIVIYLLTVLSMDVLARAAKKTGIRSYEAMGRKLFGRGGDIFTAVIMFVKCFGACISYVISVSDVIHAFINDDDVTGYWRTKSWNRVLTTIIFLLFMLPLSLPKRINTLRFVSLFGVVFIIYFVIAVTIHCAKYGMSDGLRDDLLLFRGGNEGIRGLGIFMFAYLCQSNMFEVWNEMRPEQSVRQMTYQTALSMLICTILYWFTGFFGYVEFGSGVSSSILKMYRPLHEVLMAIAYVGIVIKLCVAFSLHILPCRDSIHHLIGWSLDTVAWWKNALLCTVVCSIALLAGLFIPDVNVVFGLLGSFSGGFIAFVFPALFYMYAGNFSLKEVGSALYFSTYALLISGVIAICFGTTSTIYGVAT